MTGPSSGHGGYGEFVIEYVIYLMLTWNDLEKMCFIVFYYFCLLRILHVYRNYDSIVWRQC